MFVSFSPPKVYEIFNYILFILLRKEFGIWCAIFSFWIWIVVLLGFEPQKCVLVFFSLIINFLRYVFFVLDITECHRIHVKHYSNKHHNTPKLTWLGLSKPTFTGNEHQPEFIINYLNYTHTNSHKKLSNIN